MRITLLIMTLLLLRGDALPSSGAMLGGPSFNAKGPELARLSQQAGGQLHLAFSEFHNMLSLIELADLESARLALGRSVGQLDEALNLYREMVRSAPRQELVLPQEGALNEDQRRAITILRDVLSRRDIAFPSTERDLAELAVRFVSGFREQLSLFEVTETDDDLEQYRRLFSNQALLLNVGVLASIVWSLTSGV